MRTQQLGSEGPEVSAIGLGTLGMCGAYGDADDAESVATIRAALDAGVTLIDTGDFYGMGRSELLLREALSDGGGNGRSSASSAACGSGRTATSFRSTPARRRSRAPSRTR